MDKEKNTAPNYDKELSVGTYTGKKIYETVVGIGSTALGVWGGLVAAAKLIKPGTVEKVSHVLVNPRAVKESVIKLPGFMGKLPGLKNGFTQRQLQWGGFGGALIGSIAGGLVLGYEHWQKVKREQMQVNEITKDISDIEVFKKTDPELKAENERLWAQVNERKSGSHMEHHAKREHASHADAVRAKHADQSMPEREI